jgi:hypothetical protein
VIRADRKFAILWGGAARHAQPSRASCGVMSPLYIVPYDRGITACSWVAMGEPLPRNSASSTKARCTFFFPGWCFVLARGEASGVLCVALYIHQVRQCQSVWIRYDRPTGQGENRAHENRTPERPEQIAIDEAALTGVPSPSEIACTPLRFPFALLARTDAPFTVTFALVLAAATAIDPITFATPRAREGRRFPSALPDNTSAIVSVTVTGYRVRAGVAVLTPLSTRAIPADWMG